MARLIDADKLKKHYAWWQGGTLEKTLDEMKRDFDTIVDLQPTVEAEPQMVSFREGDKRLYVDPDYLVELYRMVRRDEIVRVIRCKDCKFFKIYPPTEDQDYTIYDCERLNYCTDNAVGNKPEDFCSRGERKEVEE